MRPASDDGHPITTHHLEGGDDPRPATQPDREIVLLGNLQTGKTTLFHRLCGERAWHGPTTQSSSALRYGRMVPVLSGSHRLWHRLTRVPDDHSEAPTVLVDTPGVSNLLQPQSEEEEQVRQALLDRSPDVLLVVADARNLRRGLALLLQASMFERPMVLALNMRGHPGQGAPWLDRGALEAALGLPVVFTSARADKGTARLHRALSKARRLGRSVVLPRRIRVVVEALEGILSGVTLPSRAAAMAMLTDDHQVLERVRHELGPASTEEAQRLVLELQRDVHLPLAGLVTEIVTREAERLVKGVSRAPAEVSPWVRRLGDLAQHPVWGVPIALAVVAVMYVWVGEIGATRVVDWLGANIFDAWLIPLCERLTRPTWPLLRDALMDPDFGLLPTGLFLAFGIVLPVLFFFYLAFAVLNQSGYLARLTILMDRLLRGAGLNGKGVLPLAMGFSCVTMALITTRILETRRERLIASFLLMLAVPCAPLLAVMLVILGDMPLSAWLAVSGVLAVQVVLAGIGADRALHGRISDFILELPPLRLPNPGRVLGHTVRETWSFMREAVPFFLAASFALFVADRLGGLALLEQAAHPVTAGLLGLPDEAVQVFVKTLIRRENGATELDMVRAGFTNLQVVVTLLMMVLLTPCVNAVLLLYKQQGLRDATTIIAAVTVWALLVGAAVFHVSTWLGLTFG